MFYDGVSDDHDACGRDSGGDDDDDDDDDDGDDDDNVVDKCVVDSNF